eukprot:Transcript_5338.p1 GENE.Transcript_5338~~Transcript_5338.p1  ORF type:complete len:177 (+),score=8.18 Transcript_5338:179-709(+)
MPMHQQNPGSTVEAPSPREGTYLREHQGRIERAVAYAINAVASERAEPPLCSVARHILKYAEDAADLTLAQDADEAYLREHHNAIERAVAYAIKAAISDRAAEPLQSVAEHILQFVTEGMAEAQPILATRQEPYSILQMRESSIRDEGDRRSEPLTASMPTASSPTASSPTSAEAA